VALSRKSSEQATAILIAVVIALVAAAKALGLPVVIEKLNFRQKKKRLKSAGYNRMLSAFAYKKFHDLMVARCIREGVELMEVNAAYTSIIGELKLGLGLGLSRHQAAACAIGRRGMKFSERARCLASRNAATVLPVERVANVRVVWAKANELLVDRRRAESRAVWLANQARHRALKESRGGECLPRGRRSNRSQSGGVSPPTQRTDAPVRAEPAGHGGFPSGSVFREGPCPLGPQPDQCWTGETGMVW
jgi:IS605 OrfB family transposase